MNRDVGEPRPTVGRERAARDLPQCRDRGCATRLVNSHHWRDTAAQRGAPRAARPRTTTLLTPRAAGTLRRSHYRVSMSIAHRAIQHGDEEGEHHGRCTRAGPDPGSVRAENGKAARRLLAEIEKVDTVDDNVQDRRRGDRGAIRSGAGQGPPDRGHGSDEGWLPRRRWAWSSGLRRWPGRSSAARPAGMLDRLRSRFRDIGIDDKFMKQITSEIEKGASALFVQYEGDMVRVDRRGPGRDQGGEGACSSTARSRPRLPPRSGTRRAGSRGARRRRGRLRLRDRRPRRHQEAAGARPSRPPRRQPPAEPEPYDLTLFDGIWVRAARGVPAAAGITTFAAPRQTSEPELRHAFTDAARRRAGEHRRRGRCRPRSPSRATGRA